MVGVGEDPAVRQLQVLSNLDQVGVGDLVPVLLVQVGPVLLAAVQVVGDRRQRVAAFHADGVAGMGCDALLAGLLVGRVGAVDRDDQPLPDVDAVGVDAGIGGGDLLPAGAVAEVVVSKVPQPLPSLHHVDVLTLLDGSLRLRLRSARGAIRVVQPGP